MQQFNMSFMLFLLEHRSFKDLKEELDEAFGQRFEQDLEYKADGIHKYSNYIFGLKISCRFEEKWSDGNVYRFSGDNDSRYRFIGADTANMNFHVRQLLKGSSLSKIMDFDEFRDESLRRKLD